MKIIYTASAHRNPFEVFDIVRKLSEKQMDIIITGAGWAAALPGLVDAILRALGNDKTLVVGVAFEDELNPEHTLAAQLSIKHVPGTQVFRLANYAGAYGFLSACEYASATLTELPKIELKSGKPVVERNLIKTLEEAEKKIKEIKEQLWKKLKEKEVK